MPNPLEAELAHEVDVAEIKMRAQQLARERLAGGGKNWLLNPEGGFPPDDEVAPPSRFIRDFGGRQGWNATPRGYGYPGAVHVLFGSRAAGKTWLASLWAGQELRQGRHVAWYAFEPQRGVTERLRASGVTAELSPYFHYRPATGCPSDEEITRVCFDVKTAGFSLVVLDAMRGLQAVVAPGTSANDGDAIEVVNQRLLVPLARAGAAVLLLDHRPKDTANASAFGSERKESMADVVLRMDRVAPFGRERDGYSRVTVTKDRYGYNDEEVTAAFTMTGGVPDFTEQIPLPVQPLAAFLSSPESRKLQVLAKLTAFPVQYTGMNQLARDLQEAHGESLSSWQRAIRELTQEGRITNTQGTFRATDSEKLRTWVCQPGVSAGVSAL